MLFRYLPLFDMVNNAYNNRAAIPKRICNKTADLLQDNAKYQSLILCFGAICNVKYLL